MVLAIAFRNINDKLPILSIILFKKKNLNNFFFIVSAIVQIDVHKN